MCSLPSADKSGCQPPGGGRDLGWCQNIVPRVITRNGPVREARFVLNPDGTPDGFVHKLYVITGSRSRI
jgi:hypothetical protein